MSNNNKGIALFISLALLFLLAVVLIAVLLTAYNYASITEAQIKRLRAITLAEAGINWAYWKFRDPSDPSHYSVCPVTDTINPDSSGLNVQITVTGPSSGRYTIKSKVTY